MVPLEWVEFSFTKTFGCFLSTVFILKSYLPNTISGSFQLSVFVSFDAILNIFLIICLFTVARCAEVLFMMTSFLAGFSTESGFSPPPPFICFIFSVVSVFLSLPMQLMMSFHSETSYTVLQRYDKLFELQPMKHKTLHHRYSIQSMVKKIK